jgi:hypothetical protein
LFFWLRNALARLAGALAGRSEESRGASEGNLAVVRQRTTSDEIFSGTRRRPSRRKVGYRDEMERAQASASKLTIDAFVTAPFTDF